MSKKLTLILLTGIILLASVLRLWGLGSVPPSPDWDEVALGYNAYSVMQTGRDEYGKAFPVVLQSFDDYKPAFYMYTIIPFIPLFDLSIVAVRLPSAIFGILTVLATYFLVYELFKRKDIALVTSFLLAISPWHIQFSRVAFETNTGLAFNVFAALFFLKGLKKPWLLSLSAVCFVLGIYVYQSEKVFAPLLGLVLILIYRKELFALAKKYLISAILIGLVLAAPMLYFIATDKNALLRAKGVSIFSEPTKLSQLTQIKLLEDKNTGNILGEIFDNRRVVFAKEIAANYLVHYNLNWLFITGDLKRHHAPGVGNLYLWELPFLLIGIYSLLFLPFSKKTKLLIFVWFLLAPIPASITTGVPHAVRTLNFLPTFQIFIAVGLVTAYQFISKNKALKLLAIGYLFFAIFNFLYYLNQYFVQQNYYNSEDWQYGYAKVIPFIKENENKYSKIIVTNQSPLDQSYMFFLFYLKYPPKVYQADGNTTAGFREHHKFGKYEFRPIDWPNEKKTADMLFVGRPADFPRDNVVKEGTIKRVDYLDGQRAIKVVKGK
ncbi:glycosyltransferase family 39 protein [Candidatus Roizmanbacteria bacterium]|nr:glycosyltransferase family 39 protein [Candidatus Roizmanbacteria bacterium]